MHFTEIVTNTTMIFRNISTASAPIQSTAARVKYWISADMVVHTISFSFRSIPTKKINSKHNSAMESWKWNFVAARWRSFLQV